MGIENKSKMGNITVRGVGTVSYPPGTITVNLVIPPDLDPSVREAVYSKAKQLAGLGVLVETVKMEQEETRIDATLGGTSVD